MSCGGTLVPLRLALEESGHAVSVELLPDAGDPTLLARPAALAGRPDSPASRRPTGSFSRRLLAAKRIAARSPRAHCLSQPPSRTLRGECPGEDAVSLVALDGEGRRRELADAVAEGDRMQARDPRYRQELASWLRPNASPKADGLPGYAIGFGDLESRIAPWIVRTINWGGSQARADRKLALEAPLVAILSTVRDESREVVGSGTGSSSRAPLCDSGKRERRFPEPTRARRQLRERLRMRGCLRAIPLRSL